MAPRRYRCGACGNLTRFDVVTDRRTRAFHHFSVGGDLTVEEEQVLSEQVVEVSCRWCGHGRAVEAVASGEGDAAGAATGPPRATEPGAGATDPAAAAVSHPRATVSGTTEDGERSRV